jgi:hypothetical protein
MVGGAVLGGSGPGGADVIRGVAFQLAQALSDVVDLVVDGDGDAVVVEGAVDVVDYEVLDRAGRRIAGRQAKTRREPGTWGAGELARILCALGEVDDSAEAELAFVTDAQLNDSGRRLNELIATMQAEPDEQVLRREAAALGRGGVQLPALDVVRRTRILTRMGTPESRLDDDPLRRIGTPNVPHVMAYRAEFGSRLLQMDDLLMGFALDIGAEGVDLALGGSPTAVPPATTTLLQHKRPKLA